MKDHSKGRLGLIIGVIVVLLILLGLLAFAFIERAPLSKFVGNYTALRAIYGSHLVEGPGIGENVVKIGFFDEQAVTNAAGSVVDYAHSSKGDYAVILSPDGRDENVFSLSGGTKQITNDGGIKSALAVSPDGTSIAYAELASDSYHANGPSMNLADWSVHIQKVNSSTSLIFDAAYQPQFFTSGTSTVVAFMQPEGIMMENITTHTAQLVNESSSTTIISPLFVSPDGTHALSYDQTKSQYVLYNISGAFPFTLEPRASMPPLGHVIGMDNNGIYTAVASPQTKKAIVQYMTFAKSLSTVWTYSSDEINIFKIAR